MSKEVDALVVALANLGIMVKAVEVTPLPTTTPVPTQPPTTAPVASGVFSVKNGQLFGPDAKPFLARGINVNDSQMQEVMANDLLVKLFPGLNIIRLNCRSYADPSTFDAFVSYMTKRGIVTLFDDHTGISKPPYIGTQLADEVRFFTRTADHFKDNTYVWINGFNEPGDGTNLAGITAQQVAIYNGIRGVSPNVINVLELPSGGNPGLVGTAAKGYDGNGPMPASAYANMRNIVWGPHFYGWMPKFSTDRATVQTAFTGSVGLAQGIAAVQSIHSADGVVPVIIGEFGNSTTGDAIDVDGDLVDDVVGTSGYGFIAWHWDANSNPNQPGDRLVSNGALTDYGKKIAALILKAAGGGQPVTAPPVTTAPVGVTTVFPGDGNGAIDVNGVVWSISAGGNVLLGGTSVPGGGGTSKLSIIGGVAVAYDSATANGYTWSGTQWVAYTGGTGALPSTTVASAPSTNTGGTVSPGKWLDGRTSNMSFKVLLPNNFVATVGYPIILYLHQLDMGTGNNVTALMQEIDPWFNGPTFRSKHAAIVVVPLLDQSADPSGNTVNFGGVSSGVVAGRDNALVCLQAVRNAYNNDPRRISVTGNSLGGIGAWEMIAFRPDLFCAAMPLAGASYSRDVDTTCTLLKDKPIWSIHGANDTSVPLAWDRAISAQMKSIGGVLKYSELAGMGHDVWDTVYPDPQYLGWLMSQSM
jgi:predicted esterase